jgi:hypothetical protein
MNIDLGNIVKSAVPESEGRNVRILSDNMSKTNFRDGNFLSKDFPRSPPKLYITGDDDDFDELTLAEWRDEGFDVEYISMESQGSGYLHKIKSLSKEDLGPCEKFGIIGEFASCPSRRSSEPDADGWQAYDNAAAVCLEHFHIMDNNPEFKLGLLVAYYPTAIPDTKGRFPSSVSVLVHLAAGAEVGVTKQSQMIGIQGKKRTKQMQVQRGIGTGGTLQLAYPSYTYDAEPGFAEHDMEQYDGICGELAWSRSLAAARKVFGTQPDIELVLEKNVHSKFDMNLEARTLLPAGHLTIPR